jgi:hypothetical protein
MSKQPVRRIASRPSSPHLHQNLFRTVAEWKGVFVRASAAITLIGKANPTRKRRSHCHCARRCGSMSQSPDICRSSMCRTPEVLLQRKQSGRELQKHAIGHSIKINHSCVHESGGLITFRACIFNRCSDRSAPGHGRATRRDLHGLRKDTELLIARDAVRGRDGKLYVSISLPDDRPQGSGTGAGQSAFD